jgi:hypothetical protein
MRTVRLLSIVVGAVSLVLAAAVCHGAEPTADEPAAWEVAVRKGTPTAFADYFGKYPDSPRIKTRTGTVRGRYWFKINDPKREDGVIVTVEGMAVLVNVSVEEAKSHKVIDSKSVPVGLESNPKGKTFNYVFGEIIEGGYIVAKMVDDKPVYDLIEPRDNLNSTVILSADGKRLLAWDVRNAQAAKRPSQQPTFIAGAASVQPFKDVPAGISKEYTPESQSFTVNQKRRE